MIELQPDACESLTVVWREPPGVSPQQIDHYSLLISQGTRAGGAVAANATLRRITSFAKGQLLAASTYGAELKAVNPRGASKWSERLIATTPTPSRAPLRPPAPVVSVEEQTCNVQADARLPVSSASKAAGAAKGPGRRASEADDGNGAEGDDFEPEEEAPAGAGRDCAGAESLELQALRAGSTEWRTLRSKVVGTTRVQLRAEELKAASAYRFRFRGSNRHGASEPGDASAAVVGGLPASALQRPPVVRATSSASFEVELPAALAPCLDSLAWTVLVRVAGRPGWQVLGTASQASTYAAERLRCGSRDKTAGCEFKLRPDVHGFGEGDLDGPSTFLHNAKLPPITPSAVRVELKLRGEEWNSLLRSAFNRLLAARLGLREEPEVVEAHPSAGDLFVVVDLRHWAREAAQEAAQQMADLLADGALSQGVDAEGGGGGGGAAGNVLSRVDRSAGVQQQRAVDRGEGEWAPLRPKPKQGLGKLALLLRVAPALLSVGLCAYCVMRVKRACQRRRQLAGAVPLATSEEDADDDDDDDDQQQQGTRTSSKWNLD